MFFPWRIDHAQAWAGAGAVLLLGNILELVGGFDFELVEAYPCQYLPLIVQA
ncbi:hypothetical protein D3C84_1292010 [compost metagenome]